MRYQHFVTRPLMALLIVAAAVSSANAGWHDFWHGINVGYHRNNAWPQPFSEVDAVQTVSPFQVMARNGWRAHNTMGHEFFRAGDGALLASGHNRVQWIATECPEMRREIYVLRGKNDAETQARVASVRQTLSSMPLASGMPHVAVTDRTPTVISGGKSDQDQPRLVGSDSVAEIACNISRRHRRRLKLVARDLARLTSF